MNETFCQRRERKQAEAQERQERYNALTQEQRIAQALERGHEGTREYKRLTA